VDAALGLGGFAARAPMLLLLACVWALAAARALGPYVSCLLVFAVFVSFNSVFYTHYPIWMTPFVPLAALEATGARARSA
jgi:hypothetical protein